VVADDIFVAGDVARFPHPVYDYQLMALEQWGNAVDQAEIAAHNMVSAGPDLWPHVALPVFWSTQFGVEIKSIRVPTFADEVVVARDRRPTAGSWPPTAATARSPPRSPSTTGCGWSSTAG
jgi:NADPH-dependent 2,4-dienoyl-CoA reductase/sulfur reductase-like enzyme